MAEVTIDEVRADAKVNKGQPIRPDQLRVDFTVKLTTDSACCALIVAVYEAQPLWLRDRLVAYTDNKPRLLCWCLRRNEERKFRVYGGGSVPGIAQPSVPSGRELLMPQLSGVWPKSDGPGDNTIELYAKIEVIRCNQGCNGIGDVDCKPIPRDHKDFVTIGEETSRKRQIDVEIVDGTGWEELWDWLSVIGGFLLDLLKPFFPLTRRGGKAAASRRTRRRSSG